MSPQPAGSAKAFGRMPYAAATTNVNPATLHDCNAVSMRTSNESMNCRKAEDTPNHTKNTTIGESAAAPAGKGPSLKIDSADAETTAKNQAAISPPTSLPNR